MTEDLGPGNNPDVGEVKKSISRLHEEGVFIPSTAAIQPEEPDMLELFADNVAEISPEESGTLAAVADNVAEIPHGVAHGAITGVNEAIELVEMVGEFVGINGLELQIPNVDAPKTITGKLTGAVSQFLTGFAAGGVALKGVKVARIGARLAKGSAQGAIADFAFFDGQEKRFSDLALEYPALRNILTESLATSPDDTEFDGRVKNAIEGLGIGALGQGLFMAVKALRTAGIAKRAWQHIVGEEPAAIGKGTISETFGSVDDAAKMISAHAPSVESRAARVADGAVAKKADSFVLTPESITQAVERSPYARQAGQVLEVEAKDLGWSQTTVSYRKKRKLPDGQKIEYTYDDIKNTLYNKGWLTGDPDEVIDAVIMPPEGKLTSIDNTRLTAVHELGGVDRHGRPIRPEVRIRRPDEALSVDDKKRFENWKDTGAQTWGDIARTRIRNQSPKIPGQEYRLEQPPRVTGRPK